VKDNKGKKNQGARDCRVSSLLLMLLLLLSPNRRVDVAWLMIKWEWDVVLALVVMIVCGVAVLRRLRCTRSLTVDNHLVERKKKYI
jgi:uncharacterized integral membrane protein